jgi:hypothetical protein
MSNTISPSDPPPLPPDGSFDPDHGFSLHLHEPPPEPPENIGVEDDPWSAVPAPDDPNLFPPDGGGGRLPGDQAPPPIPVDGPKRPEPPKPPAGPIVSGLGPEVDKILNLSPYLRELWATAKANGWHIELLHNNDKSFAQVGSKTLFINPADVKTQGAGRPGQLATLAAHEMGHAMQPPSSRTTRGVSNEEDYVKKNIERMSKDEGEAALVNLIVREQIRDAGGPNMGPDIGVRGGLDEFYEDVYKRFKSGELSWDEASVELGKFMAEEPEMKDGTSKQEVWEEQLRDEWRKSQNPGFFP